MRHESDNTRPLDYAGPPQPGVRAARSKALALAVTLVQIGTFCGVLVSAGHAVLPVGVILIGGSGEWGPAMVLAWASFAVLLVSDWADAEKVAGAIGLFAVGVQGWSLFIFVSASDAQRLSIATAFPFATASVVRIVYCLVLILRAPRNLRAVP